MGGYERWLEVNRRLIREDRFGAAVVFWYGIGQAMGAMREAGILEAAVARSRGEAA